MKLEKVLEVFRGEMALRLQSQEQLGWTGEDKAIPIRDYKGDLFRRILKNALEGDWVDVANLAMIAWYHDA